MKLKSGRIPREKGGAGCHTASGLAAEPIQTAHSVLLRFRLGYMKALGKVILQQKKFLIQAFRLPLSLEGKTDPAVRFLFHHSLGNQCPEHFGYTGPCDIETAGHIHRAYSRVMLGQTVDGQ